MPYTDFSFEPNNTDKFVDGSTKLNKTNLDKLVNNIVANHNDIGAANTNITSLVTNKVDKVTGTANDIVTFGSNGAIADSGKKIETSLSTSSDSKVPTSKAVATHVTSAIATKANKVSSTTADHFVSFSDTNGTLKDSGKSASDFSKVEAVTGAASGTALTGLKVDGTSYTIPQGGGSSGVSSIGGKTGAITLSGGLSIDNSNVLSGPDLSGYAEKSYVDNGFVTKLTGTSAAYSVYAFNNDGDAALPVINGTSTGTVEPSSGDAMLKSTNGRIRVATPIGPYHAATKKYVDDNFAPKAANGYAELDSNGAVQGLKDVFVDFGGKALGTNTLTEGQKLYSSLSTYGFSFIANGRDFDNTQDINPQIVVSKGTGVHDGILFTYTYINTTTISIDEFDYEVLSTGDISRNQA